MLSVSFAKAYGTKYEEHRKWKEILFHGTALEIANAYVALAQAGVECRASHTEGHCTLLVTFFFSDGRYKEEWRVLKRAAEIKPSGRITVPELTEDFPL